MSTSNLQTLILNFSDKGGGAEQFATDLYSGLPAASLLVGQSESNEYLLPYHPLQSIQELPNKLIRSFFRKRNWQHLVGFHDSFHLTYNRLRKSTLYQNAHIVHMHNLHGGWFDIASIDKIANEKKSVWTLHDMWCMTGGEAYVFDDTGYKSGQWNTPYIKNYPLNNPFFDRREYYLELKKNLYRHAENLVFVPVSNWLETCLKNSYVFHSGMRIKTIKNGVNLQIFNSKSRTRSMRKKRVLFFNSLSPYKGSETGLKVLKEIHHDAEIWIAGAKPSSDLNYKYIGSHISNRQHLSDLYRNTDILLFPSKAENMPLTVLEAMACGVTVVAAAVGGIPEVVLDHSTGFLANDPTFDSLLSKLELALQSDIEQVSTNAEMFINEFHNFDRMLEEYLNLYSSI